MGIFRQFPYSNFHDMNMDEIIKLVRQLADEWAAYQLKWNNLYTDTQQALDDFKAYVYSYFDNLDVQAEINNKIDDMVADGTFSSIVRTQLAPVVTAWLDENITTPETVVIDSSLTIAGAAADAKAAGDAIHFLNSEMGFITKSKLIPMNSGYYIAAKVAVGADVSLSPVASATHEFAIIDCSENDVFFINSRGTSVGVSYAFIDTDNKLINRSVDSTYTQAFISAPAGAAKLIINNYLDGVERYSYRGNLNGYYEPFNVVTNDGFFINGNSGDTATSTSRSCTPYIEIEPDTEYYASFVYLEGNASICEYSKTHKFLRAKRMGTNEAGLRIKTGSDAKYIRLSGWAGFPINFGKFNTINSNTAEIADLKNAHEVYNYQGNPLHIVGTDDDSINVSISDASSDTIINVSNKNLYDFGDHTMTRNGVTFTYDASEGSITIDSEGATGNAVTGASGTVNGQTADYDFKLKLKSNRAMILSVNPSEELGFESKVFMQFFSSTTGIEPVRDEFARELSAGREYAVRVVVLAGWSGHIVLKPQLEFGSYATEFEPHHGQNISVANIRNIVPRSGQTNFYTNDNSTLNVTISMQNEYDKIPDSNKVAEAIMQLAPDINSPYSKMDALGPMICFIDDDTTSLELVTRYHNLFNNLNAVGNYAVMTQRLTDSESLKQLLLDYEKQGFGMLYHINYQMGESTEYFLPDPAKRNMALAEDNFVTGLRKMAEYGFTNYRYWVSPYGVNDIDMQNLAKRHGMKCLVSTGNNAQINRSNANRWNIPRYGFSPTTDNTQALREAASICIRNKGLMVVTTHVNTWGNDTSIDDRFKTFVSYCISQGIKVVSFAEAFETKYPMFLLNELF